MPVKKYKDPWFYISWIAICIYGLIFWVSYDFSSSTAIIFDILIGGTLSGLLFFSIRDLIKSRKKEP